MFAGIGQEFVDNEAERNGDIGQEGKGGDISLQRNPRTGVGETANDGLGEWLEVDIDLDARERSMSVEHLMHEGHGAHASLAFAESFKHRGVLDVACLEVEQAGDELKVVFHAVVDLSKQHFFL